MMGRPQQTALSIMIEWHGLADTVETLASETKIFSKLFFPHDSHSCRVQKS